MEGILAKSSKPSHSSQSQDSDLPAHENVNQQSPN